MAAPGVVPALDSSRTPSLKGENMSGVAAPGGIEKIPPAMVSVPMTNTAPVVNSSRATATTIPLREPSSSTFTTTMDASSATPGSRTASAGVE